MRKVKHWSSGNDVDLAESKSGVLVTTNPLDNLVRYAVAPWPTPELLQKFSKSLRFRGATDEDEEAACSGLGFYCDLQSLNSEDAVTWSVFGNLAYLDDDRRLAVTNRLLALLGHEPLQDPPLCWLWRRVPHPEKPESSGGPEIDFGILGSTVLILGEAKWNSPIGMGQGINKDRSQIDLRVAYCDKFARKALPDVRTFIILGVARNKEVFDSPPTPLPIQVHFKILTWDDIIKCFECEHDLYDELCAYLRWREKPPST